MSAVSTGRLIQCSTQVPDYIHTFYTSDINPDEMMLIKDAFVNSDLDADGLISNTATNQIEYNSAISNLLTLGYTEFQSLWLFDFFDGHDDGKINTDVTTQTPNPDSQIALTGLKNFITMATLSESVESRFAAGKLFFHDIAASLVDLHLLIRKNAENLSCSSPISLKEKMTELIDLHDRVAV